jgi:glycosyltransferase involved in cell wall biosynthesis
MGGGRQGRRERRYEDISARPRTPDPAAQRAPAAQSFIALEAPDTLVFVPAWNEEESLPGVLDELREELPELDVLVVDDGSTDRTAEIARERGARVLSLGANRGLRVGIAAGYGYAAEHGYRFCGRVDADGQHTAVELKRLLALVRSDACDVAVGSRFVAGDGYPAYRYAAVGPRRFGHFVLRRLMRWRLDRPVMDATSGLYAVNERALPLLARRYDSGAPEVQGLIRLVDAGLRIEEVPVDMRDRTGGESKLRGTKAVMLVLTVGVTVLLGRWARERD